MEQQEVAEAVDIPNDVLEKIFKHVSIKELARVARTCHIAMNVVNTRIFVMDKTMGHSELVSFSQDGKFLVTGSSDDVDFDEDSGRWRGDKPTIRVWDLVGKSCAYLYFEGDRDFLDVALSPNGEILATLEQTTDITWTINTWDWRMNQEVDELTPDTTTPIKDIIGIPYSIAYGSDERFYVWTHGAVHVYDANNFTKVGTITAQRKNMYMPKRFFISDPVCVLELSDGMIKIFGLTLDFTKPIDIYGLMNAKEVSIPTFDPNFNDFLKLSRDKHIMATSDKNGRIKIWDLSQDEGMCIQTLLNDDFLGKKSKYRFEPDLDEMTASFSEDGKSLTVFSTNRMVRTWRIGGPPL